MEINTNKIKKNIYIIIEILAFAIFFFLSFKLNFLSDRILWQDEAHAWNIAKYLNLTQLYDLMKVEGHMLLWYLVLMPFAKLNFPYPFTIKYINWFFAYSSVLILLRNMKLNPVFKFFIVLSPVFLFYSMFARCYSIGIFFLFIACSIYKERLQKPYLYFLILVLAANTSLLAFFCALALGIPFLIELFIEKYKEKKELYIPISITIMTLLLGIFLYFQFFPYITPDYEAKIVASSSVLKAIKFQSDFTPKLAMQISYFVFAIILCTRPKAGFVYLFSTIATSVFFINFYHPYIWHLYFYFIFLIVSLWVFVNEKPIDNFKKIILLPLTLTLLIINKNYPYYIYGGDNFIYNIIIKDSILYNAKLYTNMYPVRLITNITELNKHNIFIYDLNDRNLSSYEAIKIYYNTSERSKYNPEIFINSLPKEKRCFIISEEKNQNNLDNVKKVKKLKTYTKKGHIIIYEIIK